MCDHPRGTRIIARRPLIRHDILPTEYGTDNRTWRRNTSTTNTSSSYFTKRALECDVCVDAVFEERAGRVSNCVHNCVLQSLTLRNKLLATAGKIPAGERTPHSCQRHSRLLPSLCLLYMTVC